MSKSHTLPTHIALDLALDLVTEIGARTDIRPVDRDFAQIFVDAEHVQRAKDFAKGWLAARKTLGYHYLGESEDGLSRYAPNGGAL